MLPDYSETLDGESWAEYQKLSSGRHARRSHQEDGTGSGHDPTREKPGRAASGGPIPRREVSACRCVPAAFPSASGRTTASSRPSLSSPARRCPCYQREERDRLIDAYIDGHKYVFGKRAVIYGEVDLVASMASFLDEIGMVPVLCATGAVNRELRGDCQEVV